MKPYSVVVKFKGTIKFDDIEATCADSAAEIAIEKFHGTNSGDLEAQVDDTDVEPFDESEVDEG